jgi:hypothetical protein
MNPIQEYFYRIEEPERSTLLFFTQKNLRIRYGTYHRNFKFRITVL